jgi:peptidoglycan/xylan/chitin deacetylase (PgdA/CDA1 family)
MHSEYLMVLAYHRIAEPAQKGFDTFKPNVSATPQNFDLQADLISRWFNIISINHVASWLQRESTLPPNAALITFDDGYLDNYTQAYPILKKYEIPGLIFLTTKSIGSELPFFWDLVAYCFYNTSSDHISLPILGSHYWENRNQLDTVINKVIVTLKRITEDEKLRLISQLPDRLGVAISPGNFPKLMMNWDQVRDLSAWGIEFGGHTMTHPILTRISGQQAWMEIEGSKTKIESEIERQVIGFAYPNGQIGDFNRSIKQMVSEVGYQAAFSLVNGPSSYKSVREDPFGIRRIFISHKDTLPRFAFKVSGINRIGITG